MAANPMSAAMLSGIGTPELRAMAEQIRQELGARGFKEGNTPPPKHERCGGEWKTLAGFSGLIDRCEKCGEERA